MFEKKMKLDFNKEERQIAVEGLIELKNNLIEQGRYTDAVDEILIKLINAKWKRVRSQ